MLRLKNAVSKAKQTMTARAPKHTALTILGIFAAAVLTAGAATARAQDSSTQQTTSITLPSKIAVAAPVTYDNKYELYGGLSFMNFQAGQALPKRMNLGGGELLGTYWLNHKLGLGLDYRGEAGTTPVYASAGQSPYNISRPLVYMNMLMVGAQYRGPKNQFIAVNYHGYIGASKGIFNATQKQNQPQFYNLTGLYTNRTKPIAALGGSLDFNLSKRAAIRLQPDLILEHFGTETREFFGISGGMVYRFGKR
ncbi:hypothetical protein [Edaphobacter acidisoli]|uniref:hypothetical protein n=1 Tax=Edaphobacter acidisoli TaxID=2040573 RepID=UPI0016640544|nr:hypothetical protein [Edaphobacter acidisoli]